MSRVPSFSVGAVLDQFRAALLARDIIPPDPIVADGRLHRCHAAGRNGRGDAAYVLHLDGLPAGGFENHRDGRDWETWRFDLGRTLTAAEREAFARVTQAARIRRDEDARQHQDEVRRQAERIWALARPAPDTHPYLARKGVAAQGLRLYKGALVGTYSPVPLRAAGRRPFPREGSAARRRRCAAGGRLTPWRKPQGPSSGAGRR